MVKYLSDDIEKMRAGVSLHMRAGHSLVAISILCAVLGAVGDAANVKILLSSISWFLLAVVFSVSGVCMFIGWAVSWYLSVAVRSEKKE